MQIKRFRGKNIHGYLNFDISFYDDLTFLTGINGGGKTTAINSIISILTPNISALSHLDFEHISVTVEHEEKKLTISATKNKDTTILSTSESMEGITIPSYPYDEYLPSYKNEEAESLHYTEFAASFADHPVMKAINNLPTPMFLDLDRRSRSINTRARQRVPVNGMLRLKNVFGGTLNRSLVEASALAQEEFRDTLVKVSALEQTLRTELILLLLPTDEHADFGTLAVPSASELASIAEIRSRMEDLPQILGVPRERLRRQVFKFLQTMEGHSAVLQKHKPLADRWHENTNNSQLMSAILGWSSNKYQIRKFNKILLEVEKFNNERNEARSKLNQYQKLINKFLNDNGKSIKFLDRGEIKVQIGNKEDNREVTSLSSGEAQMFVILTHLFFNPAAQNANVFIIDEPELSLHVQWQEIFIDSVLSANPNIQYIMSTHSPSIILDRIGKCKDLDTARIGGIRG